MKLDIQRQRTMKLTIGKNITTLIPPWATADPPYAYDATPTHCSPCTYDALCDYDDIRRANSRTSSTSVTTTFHGDPGFVDNFALFEDTAGGHEKETADYGMSDYGYRYYKPDIGRWVNRDPIGEMGGLNLYAMIANDSVNLCDYLGLQPCCPEHDGRPYDPNEQCCHEGELRDRAECTIWIWVGCGLDSRDPVNNVNTAGADNPRIKGSMVSCNRQAANQRINESSRVPDHHETRDGGWLFPNYGGNYQEHELYNEDRGDTTVDQGLND